MFVECADLWLLDAADGRALDATKTAFRNTIHANRSKHTQWVLRAGARNQNRRIARALNNWFDPLQHACNQPRPDPQAA